MTDLTYDVFISHAFEDKSSFADALAQALKNARLNVWYSGSELRMGKSITISVNEALRNARFGIVIISPGYLKKNWAMNELKALYAAEANDERILPILHQISVDEIRKELPLLADRYAISSGMEMTTIVNRVLQVVKGKRKYTRRKKSEVADKEKTEAGQNNQPQHTPAGQIGFLATGNITIHAQNVAAQNININDRKKKKK